LVPPGTIELKEMVEIIGTLYEMEGVNADSAGQWNKKYLFIIKGPGSRDGLEVFWHAEIDLGLIYRVATGFYIFQMPLLWKKYFVFLLVSANPTPVDHVDVVHLYLVHIFLLVIGQAAGPCFPLGGKSCKFYATSSNLVNCIDIE
jgi:hypothetical protein